MNSKNLNILIKIYEACTGMASEQEDPFGHFYKGGTEKFFSDFESVLKSEGVRFDKERYAIAEYRDRASETRRFGICYDDPERISSGDEPQWCLTGFSTADEAVGVLNDKSVFKDYDGTPPRVYSLGDRSGRSV